MIEAVSMVLLIASAVTIARLRGVLKRLERDRTRAEGAFRDPLTNTYGESAIPVALSPELDFAVASNVPSAVATFSLHCPDPAPAFARITDIARVHETVFRTGEREVAILLWGVDRDSAVRAVNRLGRQALDRNLQVVDVGLAMVPAEAVSIDSALEHARRRKRPLQHYLAYCDSYPWESVA